VLSYIRGDYLDIKEYHKEIKNEKFDREFDSYEKLIKSEIRDNNDYVIISCSIDITDPGFKFSKKGMLLKEQLDKLGKVDYMKSLRMPFGPDYDFLLNNYSKIDGITYKKLDVPIEIKKFLFSYDEVVNVEMLKINY